MSGTNSSNIKRSASSVAREYQNPFDTPERIERPTGNNEQLEPKMTEPRGKRAKIFVLLALGFSVLFMVTMYYLIVR